MNKHRRPHVIGRARTTVIKTAAAMGVATAIAAGAHSAVSDSPVHAQATSEPRDQVLEMKDSQLGQATPAPHKHAPSHKPSALATDSARDPQAVGAPGGTEHGAGSAQTQTQPDARPSAAPVQHASRTIAPAPASTPSAQSPTPAPSQPPTAEQQSPAPDQQPSTPPSSSSNGGSQSSGQGGLVSGVVNGVGGLLGGLLG